MQWLLQTNNKLRSIKPNLTDSLQSVIGNRREESVLSRLHIGHSFLTHAFILKREDPPECVPCNEHLTMRHVLLDCVDTQETREKHYKASSLHGLFRGVPPDKIFKFLKEIQIYHLL